MKKIILLVLTFFPLSIVGQQQWSLDSNASSITYQAKHFLHAWSGENKNIRGLATKQGSAFIEMDLTMSVKDFNTKNSSRDANALKVLEVLSFPNIEFRATQIKETNGKLEINGLLLFHGIQIEKSISAALKSSDNKSLQLYGEFEINLNDFNIKLPSFMFKKMEEHIQLLFNFVFKPTH